jgi:hypothetical protein
MADVTHASHEAHARTPRRSGRSPEPSDATPRCVVGGLLRGQPELALLVKAAAGVGRLELVDDRLALVSTVLACRPGVLVVPPFDDARISTAPLVLRVRREAPDMGVLLIAGQPSGAGQPILRAAQAGALVIAAPTADAVRRALKALLEPTPPA